MIGPASTLYTVPNEGHLWDLSLYLGDPRLEVVEKAWDQLEGLVSS